MSLKHLSNDELRDLQFILQEVPSEYESQTLSELEGSGFTSDAIARVKSWFTPATKMSKTSSNTLRKYGEWEIVGLQIYRTPLSNKLLGVINAVSLGKFNAGMKQYGFDKFFHLGLVATVRNPKNNAMKNVILEKNSVVSISTSYKTSADTEVFRVTDHCSIELLDFVEKTLAKVGKEKFFKYDAFSNNCQWFIKYLLQANCNLYTKPVKDFLFQDVSGILKNLPSHVQPISRIVTDVAAVVSKLVGQGADDGLMNWNEFRKLNKGKGISQPQMSVLYQAYKKGPKKAPIPIKVTRKADDVELAEMEWDDTTFLPGVSKPVDLEWDDGFDGFDVMKITPKSPEIPKSSKNQDYRNTARELAIQLGEAERKLFVKSKELKECRTEKINELKAKRKLGESGLDKRIAVKERIMNRKDTEAMLEKKFKQMMKAAGK